MKPIRILIDNSGYHLQNMGDVAMLQVAAQRLREFIPEAHLQTITIAPDDLQKLIGGEPLHANHRLRWQSSRAIPVPLRRSWLSESMRNRFDETESRFKIRFPRAAARSISFLGGRNALANCQSSHFVDAVQASDLVVASGGGFLTDAFVSHANDVLTTLELAQHLNKPTIVFGQGVGPLTCRRTLFRLGRVLSRTDRIGIREQKLSQQVLDAAGIPNSKVLCTGDDAVELAYSRRSPALGNSLGINLRVANYSAISDAQINTLREVLTQFCAERQVETVPIPISFFPAERDLDRVDELMEGVPQYSSLKIEQTPEAVIESVTRCRTVVTGSYHAGVFALSQGIPVVGLAASAYYQNKFLGLIEQFGDACQLVDLSTAFQEKLAHTLNFSYENAESMRRGLLSAAEHQIKLSRSLYEGSLARFQPRPELSEV